MSYSKNALLVLVTLCCLHATSALLCKVCQEGFSDLTLCNKIGKCGNDSLCYIDVFIDNLGQKVIYSGCRSVQECRNSGLIQRRRQATNQICGACCNSDFCNTEACGVSPPKGFKECYGCDNIKNVDDCETSVLCPETQDCMTEYRYAGGGEAAYKLGCESKVQCNIRDQFIKNFTQRSLRDFDADGQPMELETTADEHPMAKQLREAKRQIDDPNAICMSCCNYRFCNGKENCHYRQEAPPPRTTPTIP